MRAADIPSNFPFKPLECLPRCASSSREIQQWKSIDQLHVEIPKILDSARLCGFDTFVQNVKLD
jgi:hypothetical protein